MTKQSSPIPVIEKWLGRTHIKKMIGLFLQEHLVVAQALQFFARGYMSRATTEGLSRVSLGCVEQALKVFAGHGQSLAKPPSDQLSAPDAS